MGLENALPGWPKDPEIGLENREPAAAALRGRRPVAVPDRFAAILDDYIAKLTEAPLSAQTRRTYASKVRQFLVWLDSYAAAGDPLSERRARDWAARDYRTHLLAVAKREPATVNNALAALGDFYARRGLGPADVKRAELPESAPRALDPRDRVAFLREVERWPQPRDRALALVPFYAGARISEVVALDVQDVRLSRRIGELRLYGKGGKVRTVPLKPQLRTALAVWIEQRAAWPGAERPALFLNRTGERLSATGASEILTAVTAGARFEDPATAHVLRHTFGTTLARAGTDLVTVAELLGHSRVETVRVYSKPTKADKVRALGHLTVDE
jgi:integrase/recombinase XerC